MSRGDRNEKKTPKEAENKWLLPGSQERELIREEGVINGANAAGSQVRAELRTSHGIYQHG